MFCILLSTLTVLLLGCGGSTDTTSPIIKPLVVVDPEKSPKNCLPAIPSLTNQAGQPQIELVGDKVVLLQTTDSYFDEGSIAIDPEDGDISEQVIVKGLELLDTSVVGDYLISYHVTDRDNNESLARYRIVRVFDEQPNLITITFRKFEEVDVLWEYYEHLPENFGEDPDVRYPVIFMNHGWEHSKRFDLQTYSAIQYHNIVSNDTKG